MKIINNHTFLTRKFGNRKVTQAKLLYSIQSNSALLSHLKEVLKAQKL